MNGYTMNTISKFEKACISAAIAFLSCQGPWSYWPEDPDNYRGIWIYAHIVSDRPVSNVCLAKMLELSEATSDLAFFENAQITISGPFSGNEEIITLAQNPAKPNCFNGPDNLHAQKSGEYKLEATVRWDSSGHFVTSKFTAETSIPTEFYVKHAIAPDNSEYNKGDTIFYVVPPNDLRSHYFIPKYSSDVNGVLITMVYEPSEILWGQNTFDLIFPNDIDIADKATFGDHHRIDYFWDWEISSINNAIDSLPVINASLPIGNDIKLLFYAAGKEYSGYVETAIFMESDSRVKARYNINDGAGIFAGMLVDTFAVNIKMPQGGIAYPNNEAQIAYCEKNKNKPQCAKIN